MTPSASCQSYRARLCSRLDGSEIHRAVRARPLARSLVEPCQVRARRDEGLLRQRPRSSGGQFADAGCPAKRSRVQSIRSARRGGNQRPTRTYGGARHTCGNRCAGRLHSAPRQSASEGPSRINAQRTCIQVFECHTISHVRPMCGVLASVKFYGQRQSRSA